MMEADDADEALTVRVWRLATLESGNDGNEEMEEE